MVSFGSSASHVKDGVTRSALELVSYKLHTLVICVSSNILCTVLCTILITYVHMLFYISINTISSIFVFSLFDSLCSEAVPVCPGTRGKLIIFQKIKIHFTHTNVYFIEHCTLTFFNILTSKRKIIPKNNHIYNIYILRDT